MRLPARTSCSDCWSGPIATRIRSRASQGREPGTGPRAARTAASTRSATRRSASSRRAMRLGLRKNRSMADRDLVRDIDLAGLQPRDQVVRRQVDQLHLVRLLEYPVGHRLALAHARDLGDDVIQALEVLDVDGGPHVDAGVEDFLDVLPALGMTRRRIAAGQVGMRKLVNQQDGRSPAQRGIEVEFLADDVAIADGQRRQPLEPFHQPLGLDPAVRLDIADDDFAAARPSHSVPLPASRRSCRRPRKRRRKCAGGRAGRGPLLRGLGRATRPGRGASRP